MECIRDIIGHSTVLALLKESGMGPDSESIPDLVSPSSDDSDSDMPSLASDSSDDSGLSCTQQTCQPYPSTTITTRSS